MKLRLFACAAIAILFLFLPQAQAATYQLTNPFLSYKNNMFLKDQMRQTQTGNDFNEDDRTVNIDKFDRTDARRVLNQTRLNTQNKLTGRTNNFAKNPDIND